PSSGSAATTRRSTRCCARTCSPRARSSASRPPIRAATAALPHRATGRSASEASSAEHPEGRMNDLLRDLAPITDGAWKMIDDQARQTLVVELAARKLMDFAGPKGWQKSAMNLGRAKALKGAPANGVTGALRQVQPLVELRAPFALSRVELDNIARGAADPDLEPLIAACIQIARAEDRAAFHGWEAAGIGGICERTPHKPLRIQDNYAAYPTTVAEAVRTLKMAGVGGPYAIALGPRCYTGLMQAMGPGGFPVLEVVKPVRD